MAWTSRIQVTDARVQLVAVQEYNRPIWIAVEGNATVYIGDNAVTAANGFPLVKHSAPQLGELGPGMGLWAICDTGVTEYVRVFHGPTD